MWQPEARNMKTTIAQRPWVSGTKYAVMAALVLQVGTVPTYLVLPCAVLVLFFFWGSANLSVTEQYSQAGERKLLFNELTSERKFLGKLWLFDQSNDWICITPLFYRDDVARILQLRFSSKVRDSGADTQA